MMAPVSFVIRYYLFVENCHENSIDKLLLYTSEVEPKTLFLGHEKLSFHAPVVSSFLYCSRLGYHLEVFVFFTFVKLKLVTLNCPKIPPKFVK
jgi:hypothetical protein